MDWFRMWNEARTDAKLNVLSDSQHRVWFNLMCMASEQKVNRGTVPAKSDRILALEVAQGETPRLTEAIEVLTELEILERNDDGSLTFLNWEKRQPVSDSSTPRSQKSRSQRSATACNGQSPLHNGDATPCSVSVSSSVSEKREGERGREEYPDAFEEFWRLYPRNVNKKGALKAWKAALNKGATAEQLSLAARNYATERKGQDSQFTLHAATFLGPQERWREYLDDKKQKTADSWGFDEFKE